MVNEQPSSPQARPSDRGAASSWIIALLAALVGSVLVLGVMLAVLLGGDDDTSTAAEVASVVSTGSVAPDATTPVDPDDSTSPAASTDSTELASDADDEANSAAAPVPTGLQPLTLRGMGSIQLGMTVPEAEAALSATLDFGTAASDGCYYASDPTDVNSPLFMVITTTDDPADGSIVRIDLGETHNTRSGIHFGSTKADVLEAYGEQIVASPHPYGSGPGSEYLTYVPAEPADGDYRLIIETNGDQVVGIRAGLVPQVEWTEGCA